MPLIVRANPERQAAEIADDSATRDLYAAAIVRGGESYLPSDRATQARVAAWLDSLEENEVESYWPFLVKYASGGSKDVVKVVSKNCPLYAERANRIESHRDSVPTPAARVESQSTGNKSEIRNMSATSQWNEAVAEERSAGKTPEQATRAANKKNPGLRELMLSEANANRPAATVR